VASTARAEHRAVKISEHLVKLQAKWLIVSYAHRRNFVCDDGDLSPRLLKVVVTVTTTFHIKNTNFFLYFGQENRIFLATRSVL